MNLRNLAILSALILGMASSLEAQDTAAPAEPAAAPAPAESSSAAPAAEESSSAGPAKKISASLLLGYGIMTDKGDVNPWGVGLGVRGGYNLDKIFLGARFVYYLGESRTIPTGLGTSVDFNLNIWELGLEGGYDLSVADKLVVRPELGLGIAHAGSSGGGASNSEDDAYLALGGSLLYDVTPDIFLGADLRFQHIFATNGLNAIIILATGGMRF